MGDGASNVFSGNARNVVQAQHIYGGVHLHQPEVPVPRQLPQRVTHFTDREASLTALDSWLAEPSDSAAPTWLIVGSGGVGKTSLAAFWAHRVRDSFPDGDLYVDLRGYHVNRRRDADEALDEVLRALGVPSERLPVDAAAKATMYRTMLHGRRMLIVLDNAAAAEQIRPLLPGSPDCRVLVTSRSHLTSLTTREGAGRMSLDVLPPDRAVELLRRTAGADRVDAEPDATAELAHYCGYLPLALRIAAERLVAGAQLRIADLVAELADERERLDALAIDEDEFTTVRAVFSWSYRSLAPEAARLFRLLGLAEGADIGLDAAAALANISRPKSRRLLESLTGAHLLDEHQPQRYRFHDLVGLYAAECAQYDESAEERDAAVRRLLSWYLHATIGASWKAEPSFTRLPMQLPDSPGSVPEFTDRPTALHFYDAERANLLAAVRQAADRGEHVFAWQLPVAMFAFMLARRPVAYWLESHRIGLASAAALGDELAEAWLLTSDSIPRSTLQQHQVALAELQRAVPLWQRSGPEWAQAWALRDLGGAYYALGRDEEANEALERSLSMHVELGDEWGEATTLSALAKAEHRLHQYDEAIRHLQRTIEIRRSHGDRRLEGSCLSEIGLVLGATGRTGEAVEHLELALQLHRDVEYSYGEALDRERLADIWDTTGRPVQAREQRGLAAQLYDELGVPHELAG
ncbi:tetratricopeptide repeat protein [Saccharopolyspora sp. HNM0986]|uniref:ATP-binding protein n=1 Tax=Saccharopolyspora galaxeae TaxID=2781241 RepID=UPI00190B11C6|nr:tetratricopeptide repeat protein [Saccharopolyspora sp. HNM0986]MBK0869186.1 tetratricopeptide repeat protein [Saccharopolyspora sp. HNM0986]